MRPLRTSSPSPNGFTLIELLAVIAIVAILAAVAIPVFQNLHTKSLRAQSANNLKTLFIACVRFSNDNDMYLPSAFIQSNPDLGRAQSSWAEQLVNGGYLGDAPGGNWPVNYKVLGSPIQWREQPSITINRKPKPVYPTYGMNFVLSKITGNQTQTIKSLAIRSPSRTLFLSEGRLDSGSTYFGASVSPWGLPNSVGKDGIVTFVYADGHLGQMKIEDFPITDYNTVGSDSWYFWNGVQ
jgi:prepilin-type N-terminal cleavage/methylation domain-containing protein